MLAPHPTYQPALANLSPQDLDLPAKFTAFRKAQVEGVDFALGRCPGQQFRRFTAMALPTGSGKSIGSMALGKISGCKFVHLTATRALESQMMDEFGSSGLVNIRGRANYLCQDRDLDAGTNCEQGYELGCKFADSITKCTYKAQVELAANTSEGIETNYQYWMNVRGRNPSALEREGCPIQLLIADELHLASSECARHLAAWLPHKYAYEHAGDAFRAVVQASRGAEYGKVDAQWVLVLRAMLASIHDEMGRLEFDYGSVYGAFRGSKRYRGLQRVAGELGKITQYGGDGNWLWLQTQHGLSRQTGVRFECVWPGRYMERYVWSGVPKVVMLSGTLRPKALTIAGLDEAKCAYREWPRQFPAENNPVVWVKTGGMGRAAGDEELRAAIQTADRLYDEWAPKTNILVQSASYKRAEWLAQNSRWGRHMIINKSGEAREAAERFQASPPPCLLVSPSYNAGWDLPPKEGTWGLTHVLKLPFPDRSDPVVRARAESDPDWYSYETAQTLQQGCGRMNRRAEDRAYMVITDDAVDRFRKYSRRHFNSWFHVEDRREIPRYPG